jgi:hypothetical protein
MATTSCGRTGGRVSEPRSDSAAPTRGIPTNHTAGILLIGLAFAGTILAAIAPQFRYAGLIAGLFGFFAAGTVFGTAGRIAVSLRPFIGHTVRVEVWGTLLPGSNAGAFEIDFVLAAGVGLLIYLRPASGGARRLLKVAQPTSAQWDDADRLEIGGAGYVSWGGTKLHPLDRTHHPAVVLSIGQM